MEHEINTKIEVRGHNEESIVCFFKFESPISKSKLSFVEMTEEGESALSFIKRIKEYVKSNSFKMRIKEEIVADCKMKENHIRYENDLKKVKQELNGMEFSIKVDLN